MTSRSRPLGRPRGAGWRGGGLIGGLALVALAALMGVAIWLGTDGPAIEPEEAPTLAQVAHDPERYSGRDIVVSGAVTDVIGRHGVLLGSERLPVLVAELPRAVEPLRVAQAVGRAAVFSRAGGEEHLGVALSPELWDRFEGKAAVLAGRLTVAEAPQEVARSVSARALAADPGLEGGLVRVRGRVTERLAPYLVVVDQAAVVLGPSTALGAVPVGGLIVVSGRADTFRPDGLRSSLGLALEGPSVEAWAGRPLIRATSVRAIG